MDVVDRDAGAAGLNGRDRDVAQPDGFFDQRAGGIVLAQQVAGFVVGIQDRAVDAARGFDPSACFRTLRAAPTWSSATREGIASCS